MGTAHRRFRHLTGRTGLDRLALAAGSVLTIAAVMLAVATGAAGAAGVRPANPLPCGMGSNPVIARSLHGIIRGRACQLALHVAARPPRYRCRTGRAILLQRRYHGWHVRLVKAGFELTRGHRSFVVSTSLDSPPGVCSL